MHDFDYQRRPKLTPNKKAESLREHGRPRDHMKVQERVQASLQMSSPSGASVVPLLARLCQWRAVRGRALKKSVAFCLAQVAFYLARVAFYLACVVFHLGVLRFTWHGLRFVWAVLHFTRHSLGFSWVGCALRGPSCV